MLRNISMHSFALTTYDNFNDVKLTDMLCATEIQKLHKEPSNLLSKKIYEGAN
jgi:hypothetical protein